MFLVDSTVKQVYHLQEKLERLIGNFELISQQIKSSYLPFSSSDNFFVNTMLCWEFFNSDRNTTILDFYRKKVFCIDKEVVNFFWGIENILNLYFSFSQNQKIHVSNVLAFWKLIFPYELIPISTELELIRNSFIIRDISLGDWFYKSYCYFPYALWTYEKNQEFIKNVCKWVGQSQLIAKEKAISEAIERLSASLYSLSSKNKYKAMIDMIIEPYLSRLSYLSFSDTIISDEVVGLLWNEKKFCPLDILYYPYLYQFPCISNSNGMATHLTYMDAVESALLELIERDAYILAWLLKNWISKIDTSSLDSDLQKMIDGIQKRYNVKTYIFVIELDNPIPVCLIILEMEKKNIVAIWAAKALIDAIYKTLEEALGNIEFFSCTNIDPKDAIMQHILYYMKHSNAKKLEWLKQLPIVEYKDLEKKFILQTDILKLLKYYQNLNIEFYVYEYKNKINNAFDRYTVRVLSEQLFPIYFWKRIPLQILNSPRLKYFQNKFKVKGINLDLHPVW